ncbi:MAG: hypothetical protein WC223_00100 [Bacteroidales bacterium]|jgi:hypothetical protein
MLDRNNKFKLKILSKFILLIFFISTKAYTQCCSTGSPVCASAHFGVLEKNTLRLNASFRHSYLEKFYRGTSIDKTPNHAPLLNTFYNLTNINVGYGLLKKLTTEIDVGYYINKTQNWKVMDLPEFRKRGYGFSSTSISLKYLIFKSDSSKFEITIGSGGKIPFSSKPLYDENNTQLPKEIQPSTGAFGLIEQLLISKEVTSKIKILSYNRFEWNSENPYKYKSGRFFLNALIVSYKLNELFSGAVEVRNEIKTSDYNYDEFYSYNGTKQQINTGSQLVVISPKIIYTLSKKWKISTLIDIPIYKNYKGSQITNKFSIAFGLTRDLKLFNK